MEVQCPQAPAGSSRLYRALGEEGRKFKRLQRRSGGWDGPKVPTDAVGRIKSKIFYNNIS